MPRRRTARQDRVLAHRIEGGGRLVEHQDGRLADQRPGDLDALALAAVEVAAALLDRRPRSCPGMALDRRRQAGIVDRGEQARDGRRCRPTG